jgi:hypothetical protein
LLAPGKSNDTAGDGALLLRGAADGDADGLTPDWKEALPLAIEA